MKEAGINCATLAVFAWARLEPEEGVYEFDWLEDIINTLYENGIHTILATPTGAMPRWLTDKYEEVRKVDRNGVRRIHGNRHNFCPSSPVMREKAYMLDEKLSERFGKHPGVAAWHISNEYAGDNHESDCHCPLCQKAFQEWLKERYGTIDALNHAWWTDFWSNHINDWEEIHSPVPYGEENLKGLILDWKRFTSDRLLNFCEGEIAAVRKYSDQPMVCNLMGFFRPMNYFKWAKSLDIVSLDNYPFWHSERDENVLAGEAAAIFDLMRSLKHQPFLIMESVPSSVNWAPRCILKRPGMLELSSMQMIAHGSESVQYFQWRKGRGSAEKYHGAVIDHKNGGNTRTYREVAALGERLSKLPSDLLSSFNHARIAIVYDWENCWAVENAEAVLNPFSCYKRWLVYYRALRSFGVNIDIIDMESSLEGYDAVIAPLNYMYRGDYMERVKQYTEKGGTYVTTYWSGEVDDSDLCFTGSHPLREMLGVRHEETDVRPLWQENHVLYQGKAYEIRDICAVVHEESAEVLGTYEQDYYQGMPAVTMNRYGEGNAYLIAAECGEDFMKAVFSDIFNRLSIHNPLTNEVPYGVEVTERTTEDGRSYVFAMNFNREPLKMEISQPYRDVETGEEFSDHLTLARWQCRVLQKKEF